ncbi:MAG: hypothetical protein UHK60_02410 [Acutalibacteraceae bacterium]|nr:hypothetical protein [Acutalibacteraceae bacterium]MEE1281095.1 hypothetical protein [Acutalibacteraceae bacterium]
MKTIDMTNYDIIKTKATSSKGNQMKWLLNEYWYKQDHMGYEGLSEVVVSQLLKKSNVTGFIEYEPIKIKYNLANKNGCLSHNFKSNEEIIITLERLYKQHKGKSLAYKLSSISEVEERIKYTVDFVESVTNLKKVGAYFSTMLQLDAFFLNEDRQNNNIAFIFNEKTEEYSFCPYFDFGLSLLADTNDYPLDVENTECIKHISSKPFSLDFDEQADAATNLYGDNVKFFFTNQDIENILKLLEEYYNSDIITRVKTLLFNQKRKYNYMF